MVMDAREFELIALGHVISRYRLTGQLPNIGGKPFSLDDFKQYLFAGVDTDSDINININNVESTSNINIVEDQVCTTESEPQTVAPVENKNLFKVPINEQQ